MKRIRTISPVPFVLAVLCLAVLAGCAAKTKNGREVANQEQKPQLDQEMEDVESAAATKARIQVKGKKNIVFLPVTQGTTVSPKMRGEKELVLTFSPAVPAFEVFDTVSSDLIRETKRVPSAAGETKKMHFFLSSPVQFLLSRPEPEEIKLLLAKRTSRRAEKGVQESQVQGDSFKKPVENIRITGIDFYADEKDFVHTQISADGRLNFEPQKSPGDKIVVTFPDARIDPAVAKLYRLHKYGSHIESALAQNKEGTARIVFSVQKRVPMQVDRKDSNRLDLLFKSRAGTAELKGGQKSTKPKSARKKGNATRKVADKDKQPGDNMDTLFPNMQKDYTGKKISLDLQDADVEHVLRLIAAVKDYNLIIDQGVQGTISLRLKKVPWKQALDLVLLQKNLVKVQKENILRITTAQKREQELEQLRRSKQAELQARQSMKELQEPTTEYIQVNYTEAGKLVENVEQFLSDKGQVSSDSRTNMLIVSDVPENLVKIKSVIQKLDRAERQVLIEARIVYATDSFTRAVGLNWSYNYPTQSYYGGKQGPTISPEGTSTFPDSYNKQGKYQKGGGVTTKSINLPNTPGLDIAGNMAKIAGVDLFTLDAQLKLGETKGLSRTISSPRVVTLNNEQAEITQGTQIATSGKAEGGGTTTEYVEAALSLKVTPQITPDDKLLLDLDITNDTPVGGGSKNINTKATKTKLIVDNGETLVIGGVREISKTRNESKVPGLGDVPGLGWLFKSEEKSHNKNELLIFIRPKII